MGTARYLARELLLHVTLSGCTLAALGLSDTAEIFGCAQDAATLVSSVTGDWIRLAAGWLLDCGLASLVKATD
ncbi:MAG: hypothetical protein ACYCSN_03220 [Acidobacteriaceae bacterium]